MLKNEEILNYKQRFPILEKVVDLMPVTWLNPNIIPMEQFSASTLNKKSMQEAEELWMRFKPFFRKEFPETKGMNGVIESPLTKIPAMQEALGNMFQPKITGNLYLKSDNELPIAGSVKARGGIYEVLHYAESLASSAGMIDKNESYEQFASEEFKRFFNDHRIGVGSTGNLGLSIGIISAKLGFDVAVYMSRDARQWKKDLLRAKGATVYEFDGDFGEAITAGRKKTTEDPKGYFVDDESSEHLFNGYSTAAFRLKKQLEEAEITVNSDHPLFVYLPCGVGGAPGGITYGLKQLFGDDVHCFFVEPTHSPSVLMGLVTGEKHKVSVQDFGIDNRTEADGLAVGRPSRFASTISDQLVSGIYTIEDDILFQLLSNLVDHENIYLEPSATAGLVGPQRIAETSYLTDGNIRDDNITHIAWATGGGLVPQEEMEAFYEHGKNK